MEEDEVVNVVKAHVDCETARLEATAEALSEVSTFVPECSRSGGYLPVQCYRSEGYCWCVDPVSGRPIPGTSTTHDKPDCGPGNTDKRSHKHWRKCSGEKREVFLRKLFDWMTLTVVNSTVPYLLNSEPHLTLNQRLAKWQFISLDHNRNGVNVTLTIPSTLTDSSSDPREEGGEEVEESYEEGNRADPVWEEDTAVL